MENKTAFDVHLQNTCLIILTGIAITAALIYTRSVLVPFVVAMFIYAIISPLIKWFQTRLKLRRAIGVTITICMFLFFSALLFFFVSASIEDFLRSADLYRHRIIELIESIAGLLQSYSIDVKADSIQQKLQDLPFFTLARNLTGRFLTLVGNTSLIIIFVLFLIAGEGLGDRDRHPLISEIHWKISKYVSTKFVTSVVTGFLVGLILGFGGVELAFMFSVLTVLLNFIPSIGSIFATLLPIPVIFLQFGPSWRLGLIVILTGAVQFLIGNIIEPKIMGETMDLHPVTILIFLMFWGLVWGIPGMFLAVPITALLRIALHRIPLTRPVSELFAGRLPRPKG